MERRKICILLNVSKSKILGRSLRLNQILHLRQFLRDDVDLCLYLPLILYLKQYQSQEVRQGYVGLNIRLIFNLCLHVRLIFHV